MTPGFPSLARIKQKRAAITTLCSALETFLALDVDAELEMFEKMRSAAPRVSPVTPEMLATAQIELEKMESIMERTNRAIENLPEDAQDLVRIQIEAIEPKVEYQRAYVKRLQDQLDGKTWSLLCECGATLMKDGRAERGLIYPDDLFYGTREECAAKATECGWVIEGEEQKCPECAGAKR